MPREDANTKGLRYLAEARLIVTKVDARSIEATCRGDGGLWYSLGWDVPSRWWCSCPTVRDFCSHLVALRRVVIVPGSSKEGSSHV